MQKRVKDLQVVNPIPDDIFGKYNEWLEKMLGKAKALSTVKRLK